jgi:hypothetical protein
MHDAVKNWQKFHTRVTRGDGTLREGDVLFQFITKNYYHFQRICK